MSSSSVARLMSFGLMAAGLASNAAAAEPSGCVACHLDQAMLVKNLTVVTTNKSALQSGKG
jgi:hypothetical protein